MNPNMQVGSTKLTHQVDHLAHEHQALLDRIAKDVKTWGLLSVANNLLVKDMIQTIKREGTELALIKADTHIIIPELIAKVTEQEKDLLQLHANLVELKAHEAAHNQRVAYAKEAKDAKRTGVRGIFASKKPIDPYQELMGTLTDSNRHGSSVHIIHNTTIGHQQTGHNLNVGGGDNMLSTLGKGAARLVPKVAGTALKHAPSIANAAKFLRNRSK